MGCHTWFSVPLKTNKKEIIEKAQFMLDNEYSWMHESTKQMYQYAIDNELSEPCCELAYPENKSIDWKIYVDISDYSLMEYNKKNNTNFQSKYDLDEETRNSLESYSDEPRIGGYPDKIIHSYQEMLDFMEEGFINNEGEKYEFYYDENRYPIFIEGIKNFFEKHPDGIITFG